MGRAFARIHPGRYYQRVSQWVPRHLFPSVADAGAREFSAAHQVAELVQPPCYVKLRMTLWIRQRGTDQIRE